MKLYHGTSTENAEYIEEEGFIGGELDKLTVGRKVEGGVVFMATSINEAKGYGDAIFSIDFDLMDCEQPLPFNDGDSQHYYSTAANINRNADYRRIA